MRAVEKKGITRVELNREELWALLSFTGSTEHFSVVHFRINGSGKLEAAATDGKCSVEAIAPGAAPAGEWQIDAAHLEKCRAALASGQALAIELTKTGLKQSLIVDAASGETIAPIGWNREAASTQVTMTEIVRGLKVPRAKNHQGSWCAIDPEVLRCLTRVRVATDGCPITLYPPATPEEPLHFEATGDDADWRGAITPERVVAPGGVADEPEEDEDAPGRGDRQTKLDLDDGIIDDEEAERLKAEANGDEPELPTRKRGKGRRKGGAS